MRETKRRALRLCRTWRLRRTGPMLLFFFCLCAALFGTIISLRVGRLRAAGFCAAAAWGFFGAFRFETQALALTRATGAVVSVRERGRALLRLPLLALVRLLLFAAALLPAAGLFGIFSAWRGAAYPPQPLQRLAVCCGLMALVSLAFFFRWNSLLKAAPALLLSGAPFRRSLVWSVRLTKRKKPALAALRRSFFGWSLLGVLLLPLPFTALYRRQCETLLLLNDA